MALAESDVLEMAKIMSETCRQATRGGQILSLMSGLQSLLGAKAWVWGVSVTLRPDALPTWILHRYGGFSSESYAKFVRAQEHPDMGEITAPFARLLMTEKCHLTRMRQQTDPEDRFAGSAARPLWDDAGVAPGIMSCRPLDSGGISVAALFRGPREPLFSERERKMAHILLSEAFWLHQPEEDSVLLPARTLSPRKLTIYNLMLQGIRRRQIAGLLNLKENTVHSYAKDVFSHFGVHSQAELMTRFRQ